MSYQQLNITYPELPVVEHREEFFDMLEKHQVVIVKADTGSGKSTQLPKFLLEWFDSRHPGAETVGRSHTMAFSPVLDTGERDPVKFKIGVTEPRRLAAISIADRLREELNDETLVSTKIRFWEQGQSDAPIKVMTDGILLQEFRRDRLFRQYSAIVIDEAHERSLNIDILLGIFKTVLQARPEFKLIVASATLDAKLFEEFYDNSCVLEAEGRTFPVDVEYFFDGGSMARAALDTSGKGDSGLLDEARDAILDLESRHRDHLLCFLPTERDIQDLAGELAHELDSATFDILPLYGRMSPDEQRRIFKRTEKTRVVLATNIAETSLTIPGIAYVVDTGTARISRYNAQSRIQGLPVEDISKASARQRTGRAGRVKPGVCIRLYSPEDFEKRDEFTEPEIRRSNLANVVLQLRSLGLELENFPFLQSPPHSAFRGAYKTLFELGALTADNASGRVTKLGREMTRLPMDVALSAVLLRARDAGVLQPALIVCSALSIQDPRVVPSEEPERTRIRQLHRKFAGHKSDFLTFVCMWNAFCAEWDGKTWNKLRKFCDKNSLHFLRCREWIDLYEQFGRILDVKFENRVCPLDSFHRDNLHIALLSGFLGGVALRDIENGCYRLVSGRETHLFPGSDLYGKSVEWLFSAEVRETSRIFLNKAAEIKPEWIMQVAEPFCTRRWYAPTWNQERGFVEAVEEVSFRGLVISRGHRVDYARVNPEECAEIFWREAVVLGQMARPFAFMTHNERVVEDLHALEARKRQFGLAPSEDALVDYYVRIAHNVNSIKTLKDYIREHTDQFLKFDAAFWLEQNESVILSGVRSTESKNLVHSLIDPSTSLRFAQGDTHSKKSLPTPSLGGSLEQFRIEGVDGMARMVMGEMVFDATKAYDGITLDLPYDLLPQVTPATLALSIHQWREWMAESVIREMPKASKKQLEGKRTFIDDAFCDKLKENPHKAPLLSLYEVFAGIKQLDCDIPTITPEKENHLRLHVNVVSPKRFLHAPSTSFSTEQGEGGNPGHSSSSDVFKFELSPELGNFGLFLAVRPVLVTFGIDFSLGGMRFGWRLGESALMTPAESTFWQAFRKRVEGKYLDTSFSTEGRESIKDLVSRLKKSLPASYLDPSTFPIAHRAPGFAQDDTLRGESFSNWVLKSLVADHLDANRCVRFSGLEFSRGKKIRDFKNLAATTRTEDEETRLALVRATYESALLGADTFVKFWDILREFSVAMRQGGDHKIPAFAGMTNKSAGMTPGQARGRLGGAGMTISKIVQLYSSDGPETTLYERLCALGGADMSLGEGARNDKVNLSVKDLREKFRPVLRLRYIKDHELKKARDVLSRMERLPHDDPEYPELYLQACAMLEDFEILRFKRKGDDTEEVIEEDALAKLKKSFGRLK